jgi:hypothetical protein
MALGDQLLLMAQGYYDQEVQHLITAQNSANAAAISTDSRQARANMYRVAQVELAESIGAARRIESLTAVAQAVEPASYLTALQVLYQNGLFRPSAAAERVVTYEQQIAAWRGSELSLLGASPNPRPGPDPIGGGPPVAPPPDAATQVGILAALAGVVYAGWYFLIRRR